MTKPAPVIDIGILTIRDDEFRAVLGAFTDDAGVYRAARREYTLRYADAGGGARYTVAALRQIEQGNGEAQDAARDMLDDLSPSLLLVVGIAGGLPSDDVTLGDVIISTRVNDYNVEARKPRSKPTYSLSGGPIAKTLAAGVANLAGRSEMDGWTGGLPSRPTAKWSHKGQLYGPKRWQKDVREKLEAHFGPGVGARAPVFMAGPIASSDRLVKDPKVLFPWIETARHLLAVEMESGGVYRAARERCPMLAIRGISDIVGLKRAEAWTKYACASAAAFTRAYLRTQPVPPRSSSPGAVAVGGNGRPAQPAIDVLFANLLPLVRYPEKVYVAPATSHSYDHAWGVLLKGKNDGARVPRCWVLHNKLLYSFEDPNACRLSRIVDTGAIEEHETSELVDSDDPDRRRLFVHLLNGALRDDLGPMGVRFFPDDEVFGFAGRPDEPPRKYKYQNVHLRSTITVVSHYTSVSKKDGRKFDYLRHLAFSRRFRLLGEKWFLEVTPTYRYTTDGKKKYRFHDKQLSGIKRLEGNRAVLSQVLLWSDVLCSPPENANRNKLLGFEPALKFEIEQRVADDELTAVDAVDSIAEVESASSLEETEADVEAEA